MNSKIILIFIVFIVMLTLVACESNQGSIKTLADIKNTHNGKYQAISAETAKHYIDIGVAEDGFKKGEIVIVDVREPYEFEEGYIFRAINISVGLIGTTKPTNLPNDDAIILVYCRSGNRSKTASNALIKLGYRYVFDFGGINSWPYDKVKP